MAGIEVLYPAQYDFPESCVECPMLVGMIEDGYLPHDRRLDEEQQQEVNRVLSKYVVDVCFGPRFEEVENGRSATCTAMESFIGIKEQ